MITVRRSPLLLLEWLAFVLATGSLLGQPTLRHRFGFDADVSDSMTGPAWVGTLPNGGVFDSGRVQLAASAQQYVQLPGGILSNYTAVTMEAWVTFPSQLPSACFLFGFGNINGGSGEDYVFVQPRVGRIAITDGNWTGEQGATGAGDQSFRTNLHLVAVFDPPSGQLVLYTNGVQAVVHNAVTLPMSAVNNVFSFIGRSLYSGDSYFDFHLDEFRLYEGALDAVQVQSNFVAGSEVALLAGPVKISTQPQSQSVLEMTPVAFTVGFVGTPPVGIQWRRNGVNIVGGTNATLTVMAALTNHGANYSAVLTNSYTNTFFSVTSSNASLSVSADLVPPVLERAASLFPSNLLVTFSEGVLPSTATNPANYAITHAGGSLAVTKAEFGPTISNLVLTTAAQSLGVNYTLTVNGIRDLASSSNLVAANSQVAFTAQIFMGDDLGNPALPGSTTSATGGVDLTAGGSGFGGTSDQGYFSHRTYTNDFDVAVRVAALEYAAARTVVGLMVRPSLTSNAPFVATFASPGPAGCYLAARTSTGGATTMQGAFPVNYPDTWLRLRRTGGTFSGFASLDGLTWEHLGSASVAMSAAVEVGLALASGAADTSVTAQFRDFGNASGIIAANTQLPFEPRGPSSRRTALVITEIMYHPSPAWAGGDDLEFIELWNSGIITEDLTGHRLEGEIDFMFPAGTKIAPGQFLVIARNPGPAQNLYGVNCLGPFEGKLNNGGGSVRLLNELGGRLLEVDYSDKLPWPLAPDGTGHSLVLKRPSYGENDARAWSASDVIGGSPGVHDHFGAEPARVLVINEFLAHTDPPQEDAIELFNPGPQPLDLSGCWLSDSAGTNKYRISNGATIAARGRLSFTQTQLGFALSAEGEGVFLVNSNQTRVIDAVTFDGQENGVSFGRFPDGAPGFQRLISTTFGTSNTPPRLSSVVINEIMYHPIAGLDDDEYIELHNRGASAVSLGGWQIQDGVSFTFPSNAVIAAGGYAVVARNLTNLFAKYPHLNVTNTFGNFSGQLSNGGERLALAMPDEIITGGITNIFHIVVNEVSWRDGGRWGQWSDGGGSSLELIDPDADNRFASNWADSDESTKAAWTSINVTNILENGQATPDEGTAQNSPNRFEIFHSAGAGEVLVDDVEFRSNASGNRITNSTFAIGTNGWVARGVVRNSYAEPGVGIGGSQALRLVSTARGDTGVNKIYTALSSTATTGAPNTGTMRAAVRWLKGSPYIMLRLRGNWMEVSQRLNVPNDCGTPGLPNSRLIANAGPVITDVAHAPILPAGGQPVTVTARVSDPNGVASVQLKYRVDPGATYATVNMTNNGGVLTGVIPGQTAGTLAAFAVSATDASGATVLFPSSAPFRECHVRWGESIVAGEFGNYRLWLTASNLNFWANREKNANDTIDATFVYGNYRVVYNVDTMYSGSPFHAPAYNGPTGSFACDYEVNFPPDDKFLGAEPTVLSAYDVNGSAWWHNDDTAQVDLTGTWIGRKLGQQYNYRRQMHLFVNGIKRGTIYDDTQQPNSEMLAQYYPDDENGDLRKIESWFEFNDNGNDQSSTYAVIRRTNKSTGEVDAKRYRWNWRPRATRDPNDWFDFTNLVVAVSSTNLPNFTDRLKLWMDVPNFLRPIITHHVCGSWDSYAYDRGKNMYAYKPDGQPWRLLMWDIEISLGANGAAATDSIYKMFDATLLRVITNNPSIHREYLRGFKEAVDGPLAPGVADVALDERYAAFQLNNVGLSSPQSVKNYLAARRSYLQSVLPNAGFALTNGAYQVVTTSNAVVLGGTGSLDVESLLINGVANPVTWSSVTQWQMLVPLAAGTNVLNVAALDRNGGAVSNATASVTVNYTGAVASPEGSVLFNEIMYRPVVLGAEFIELFNAHSNQTFDLSGWRVNGVGYTFPSGSTLGPRSHLVLASDPVKFNLTYGPTNLAFDQFTGTLDPDGETLTLLRPGTNVNEEIVVDRVRYEAVAPWPVITNGASLQLVDAAQDNSRVANWRAATNGVLFSPCQTNNVSTNLPPFPPLWLNELQAVNLTGPLDNFSQRDPWAELHHAGLTNFSLTGYYLSDNYTNLTKWAFPAGITVGSNGFTVAWCDNQAAQTAGNVAHAAFTLPAGAGRLALSRLVNGQPQLVDYLAYTNLTANWSYGDVPDGQPFFRRAVFFASPAATNNGASAPIEIYINEWLADNAATLVDPADGSYEDWFELYNPGTNAVDLGGYCLTDNLTNKFQFQIPNNGRYVVPAGGYLLVWADNEANQNSTNRVDLHAGFALGKGGEAIGLFAADGTAIDAITFSAQTTDVSEGRFPNGAVNIYAMPTPTPRAANILPNTPPVLVAISNRVITLGQTLSFTAQASDADLPAQSMLFSLSNAPVGAVIGGGSGVFSWTPSGAPATNVVTVAVADGGLPTMSDATSFTVIVAPRPAVYAPRMQGGNFVFDWATMVGQSFRVESTASLATPVWVPLGDVLNGAGAPLSFTNILDGSPQRYFRVRVLP